MSLLYGKKGDVEQLQSFIIYIIFVLIVFIALLVFIRNSASGAIVKEQVLAKQISLLVDSSLDGTELTVEKGKFIVSADNNKVHVKSSMSLPGYSHYFLSERQIQTEEKDDKIVIKILK